MLLGNLRKDICQYSQKMLIDKLVVGPFGNISAREGDMITITPSGMDYEDLEPEDIVVLDLGGRSIEGDLKPSSELAMHTYIYEARPDIQAIVHTHSTYATALACLGRGIPVFHYVVVLLGGAIPLARYATYGTKALAENVLNALGKTHKVAILENHGAIAVDKTVKEAYQSAVVLEHVAEIYLKAQAIGEPTILSPHQIEEVKRQFKSYGQAKPKS